MAADDLCHFKSCVTTSAAVAVALMGAASNASAADYQVTVTNLTSGIYFTPLIAGAHSPDVALFRAGTEASPELQTMAEGGNVAFSSGYAASHQ